MTTLLSYTRLIVSTKYQSKPRLEKLKCVEKIILQGEVFGPLECSVTVDTFGKECLEKEKHLYVYKNEVGIPPLAMIDDLVCPAVCGVDSVLVNAYINAKTNVKKLQFGVKKCHQLHIGKANDLCPTLKVDNWELHKVDEVKLVLKI